MITQKMVVNSIKGTAMLCGFDIADEMVKLMVLELKRYGAEAVIDALNVLRSSHNGRFCLADIVEIIESKNRPASDEAWAIAIEAIDESKTVVWNNEIIAAFSACRSLLDIGDKIAARVAFKQAYEKIVAESRKNGSRPIWEPSLGHDTQGREIALSMAVRTQRITQERAQFFLQNTKQGDGVFYLTNSNGVFSIGFNEAGVSNEHKELFKQKIADVKKSLSKTA